MTIWEWEDLAPHFVQAAVLTTHRDERRVLSECGLGIQRCSSEMWEGWTKKKNWSLQERVKWNVDEVLKLEASEYLMSSVFALSFSFFLFSFSFPLAIYKNSQPFLSPFYFCFYCMIQPSVFKCI